MGELARASAVGAAKGASRYAILFVSLLALMVVPPLLGTSALASMILGVMVTVLLAGAVVAASRRRLVLWVALVLVMPPLLTNLLSVIHPQSESLGALRAAMVAGFLGLSAAAILFDVLNPGEVDLERILGALCVYLLFGLTWSFLFALTDSPPGTALSMPPYLSTAEEVGLSRYVYFSFVTLTTLGYGDVVPISAPARGLAVVEAVLGPLYLAVLVARLVALHVSRR